MNLPIYITEKQTGQYSLRVMSDRREIHAGLYDSPAEAMAMAQTFVPKNIRYSFESAQTNPFNRSKNNHII